jgi:hypothetical protein
VANFVSETVLLGVQLTWRGQWQLNAWPNVILTITLLTITFWLAWRRGFSPLEMVSEKVDAAFVAALRNRWPITAQE